MEAYPGYHKSLSFGKDRSDKKNSADPVQSDQDLHGPSAFPLHPLDALLWRDKVNCLNLDNQRHHLP